MRRGVESSSLLLHPRCLPTHASPLPRPQPQPQAQQATPASLASRRAYLISSTFPFPCLSCSLTGANSACPCPSLAVMRALWSYRRRWSRKSIASLLCAETSRASARSARRAWRARGARCSEEEKKSRGERERASEEIGEKGSEGRTMYRWLSALTNFDHGFFAYLLHPAHELRLKRQEGKGGRTGRGYRQIRARARYRTSRGTRTTHPSRGLS